jgi:transglutaminase-like putative cysteine protease
MKPVRSSKQSGQGITALQMRWLLVVVALAIAPHWHSLPGWFWPVAGLIFVWRLLVPDRPLPRWQVVAVTAAVLLAILASAAQGLGRDIGIATLASMAVLKTLEVRTRRDAWVLLMLGFFLILARFLYGQDLALLPWLVITVWVITYSILLLEQGSTGGKSFAFSQLLQAGRYLLLAVPVALVFFVLFPRLGSPIWGSPEMFGQGKTGLGDSMSPGSIAQLFMDDSPAMRINFTSQRPDSALLYWRGPVLEYFDGISWHAVEYAFSRPPPEIPGRHAVVAYSIELEPHGQHFLPVLDYVQTIPNGALLMPDLHVQQHQGVNQVKHYRASSLLVNPLPENITADYARRLTALPWGKNPKTRQLMAQWRRETPGPEALIQRILQWFNQEEFIYTFTPPPLQGDTVDEFLFRTRAGFCEHYASAFTVMMRMAGIPARVVTGYQGGLDNHSYWLVRQSDAHAWSEVWLKGKGWLRVDPTAAVAPSRIRSGSRSWTNTPRHWYDTGWLERMQLSLDAWRYRWNRWVRGYDQHARKNLLERMGLKNITASTIAWLIAGSVLLSAAVAGLGLGWHFRRRPLLPSERIYQQVQRQLTRAGLPRDPHEGPADYLQRAARRWPVLAETADEFARRYQQARYAAGADTLKESDPAIRALAAAARRLLEKLKENQLCSEKKTPRR